MFLISHDFSPLSTVYHESSSLESNCCVAGGETEQRETNGGGGDRDPRQCLQQHAAGGA